MQEESEKREVHAMKAAATAIPNELLSHEREQRHWTQEYVAEQIGAPDPKWWGSGNEVSSCLRLTTCTGYLRHLFWKSRPESERSSLHWLQMTCCSGKMKGRPPLLALQQEPQSIFPKE